MGSEMCIRDSKYTGLRPGEKLYEELLSTKENSIETHHPKITRAKVREYDFLKIERAINELVNSLDKTEAMGIVGKMKQIVPEYQSQNSVFGQLDDNDIKKEDDHSSPPAVNYDNS